MSKKQPSSKGFEEALSLVRLRKQVAEQATEVDELRLLAARSLEALEDLWSAIEQGTKTNRYLAANSGKHVMADIRRALNLEKGTER